MNRIKDDVLEMAGNLVNGQKGEATAAIQKTIREKMEAMKSRAGIKNTLSSFAKIKEEDVLTFMPDKRRLGWITTLILALFFFIVLPGWLKFLAVFFCLFAVVKFWIGFALSARVDVPDGYFGIICDKGQPLSGDKGRAKKGRNWLVNPFRFIPYLVSLRDQIVNVQIANFTRDYFTIGLSEQIVFRIVDPAKFIRMTTPALIMKIISLYASYIGIRMITSIKDARVKFVGTQNLPNVIDALNFYLSDQYGIKAVRVNTPQVDNDIINDLEEIRTTLKSIEVMKETLQVKLESEIKEVESEMRKRRKLTRSKAIDLQQASIKLDTSIAEEVNERRQEILIEARKDLEQLQSLLFRQISSIRGKFEKAKAIRSAFEALTLDIVLRMAALKREAFRMMAPKHVKVFGVSGIGTGLGMSMGNQLFGMTLKPVPTIPSAPEAKAIR